MYFLLTLTVHKEYNFNWLVFYWVVVSQLFLTNSLMSNILLLIVRFCQSFFFYTFTDRYLIIWSSLSIKEPPQDFPIIFIYWHLPAFCLLIQNCLYSYFSLEAPLENKFSSSLAYSRISLWQFPTAYSTLYSFLSPELFLFSYNESEKYNYFYFIDMENEIMISSWLYHSLSLLYCLVFAV